MAQRRHVSRLSQQGPEGQHLIFLGGTFGRNQWRATFVAEAVARGVDNKYLYNPADHTWTTSTPERKRADDEAKKFATVILYYLTDPKRDGDPVSADCLVEATMALYDDPQRTIVVFDVGTMSGCALRHMNISQARLRERFPNGKIWSRDQTLDWLEQNVRTDDGKD